MSHIVTIDTQVRDLAALQAACQRLGLPAPQHETVELFSGQATGHCVRLPDWRYPVVCDLSASQVRYDNYEGHWGDRRALDKLLQAYAVEMTKIQARRKGHSVTEQTLADGSIKLTVQVAGGSA
jgi:hypothetical protein